MRTVPPTAQGAADLFTNAINETDQGTLLYVHSSETNPNGFYGTKPLMAIMEAPDAKEVNRLRVEGAYNGNDPAAYVLTFIYCSGVGVGDWFYFNGWKHVLVTAYPQPLGDAILGIRCLVTRTGIAAPITENA